MTAFDNGHCLICRYGPNSEELKAKVREIDELLGHMLDEFESSGLTDKVNIIIVSDHGMTEVANNRSIDLGKYINMDEDIEWIYASAIGLVLPKEGKLEQVSRFLKVLCRNFKLPKCCRSSNSFASLSQCACVTHDIMSLAHRQ